VATCSDDEALKLVEDSAVMVEHIIDMLPVDMFSGRPLDDVCKHFVNLPQCNLVIMNGN
jgi:hypothetical protein